MKNKNLTMGEKLRALRGDRTKAEVAEAVGVSFSSYVKYERDERVPNDSVKVKLANFLGSTVSYIFFE